MASKNDNCPSKLEGIDAELSKIDEKLSSFDDCRKRTFDLLESQLSSLQSVLQNADNRMDFKQHTGLFVSTAKSKLSDYIKAHRDIHLPISKFGKLVDKSFVDELSHLTTYFTNNEKKESRISKSITKPALKTSSLYKDSLSTKAPDDLLRLVIIEHLLREGHESLAVDLMHNFGFTQEEIGLEKFKELSDLVSSTQRGELEPAKKWLSDNREELGDKAKQLEYCLAKLDFLSTIQTEPVNPSEVIQSARQLVPFASDYSSDFEHLMGSLVFIGRSLEDTPYADLALPINPTKVSPESSQVIKNGNGFTTDDENTLSASPITKHKTEGTNALTEAANLFKACCCYHLNLSDTDPLLTAFSSGCRVLTRLHSLQRAIACLSKYSSLDGDMLPIAVKLDPSAHRHNIFHCPVIKEVISDSNDGGIGGGPVRLTCGHAISRDAFNSLASGDRSRMKCPYCPVETFKNQVLDLIF
ncbi:E3 ubiquitin-protein ligase [Schistosoma japonicum]|uniref:Protein RMD5 homolog A n=1 Tax=Schistosoma japonicum TaxID=6182 RepID=C1L6S1_SCHJA|nr:E3 ubiquitin-protein ligase [Schistosoma japonicum]CAX70399.1 Protein RMD5 homolog A [Schistosoma japonicum]